MKAPKLATHVNTLYGSFYRVVEHATNTEIFLWEDSKWVAISEEFNGMLLPVLEPLAEDVITYEHIQACKDMPWFMTYDCAAGDGFMVEVYTGEVYETRSELQVFIDNLNPSVTVSLV